MLGFVYFLPLVLLCLIFYLVSIRKSSIPKGLKALPSERGLPVIGIFHQIKKPFCVHFANLGKVHGPLFRTTLGMRDIVVLNNYDIIKRTLKDDGDNFAGRFKTTYYREGTRNSGILFHDGEMWTKQRAFILNVFRDFGVNTTRYQDIIQEECSLLLNELVQMEGLTTEFGKFSSTSIANIISKFVLNKRFDLESEAVKDFNKFLVGIARSRDMFQIVSMMFPFLDNSTLFFKLITTFSSEWDINEKMHKYYQKEVEEHLEKLDFNSGGEDLIDRFLIKQREMQAKTGTVDSFTNCQLIRNIIELFLAGFETVSTTLGWSLFFMSRYPKIQEKVYSEIIEKIGTKQPWMSDKVSLVYSQAVMDEILRLSAPVPLTLIHQTFVDCSVDGYFIPKRSVVFPNIYACHHDPNTWENPMEFNPGRFLSRDENGEMKYTPREDLIPFGIGKRICLGESLARMEYFIFFTRILQRFKVEFCEEISEKKYEEVLVANEGIIRHCSIKNFTFTIRN